MRGDAEWWRREFSDLVDLRGREHAAIIELHTPTDEEVESWADDEHPEEHDHRFPDCPGCATPEGRDCEGHTYTIQTCSECGYTHDGDYPAFRPWPCATLRAIGFPSPAASEVSGTPGGENQ